MKIFLHGKLAKLYGSEPIEIQTNKPAEALEGMSRQLPDWPRDLLVDVVDFDTGQKLHEQTSVTELHLVPSLTGGGGGIGKIIIGVVAIAAAFIPGIGPMVSAALFSLGASMVVSGVMQLFMKAPTTSKSEDPPASKYLGNNKNTTAIGTYRTIAYGRTRIAGHWLSIQVDAKSLVMGRFPVTPPA